MNFFEAQERSQRRSKLLIWLMLLATGLIAVAVTVVVSLAFWLAMEPTSLYPTPQAWAWDNPQIVGFVLCGTLGFIFVASLYRTATLRSGGSQVARELGATRLSADAQDPAKRTLRNVVEEIAIASGVPVPEIYVMENEAAINAFAAGFQPEDAAIAVTRGAIEQLSRDELQGVVAHEFSHILNGDMRLNIRLMGPMFGMLVIGLLGRMLLRSMRGSRGGRKGNGHVVILLLGGGLSIAGSVGVLFARIIKASVSRQREFLADASAV
ncbi:MAG: M48 family metalloprotease, partial [Gammaproteobacteria bacterium]